MKVVITVVGKDRIGILAKMANACADNDINILDVSQTIVDDIFTMTMIADTALNPLPLSELAQNFAKMGEESGLVIKVMSHDIFDSMHRI